MTSDNVRPLRRPFGALLPSGRRWKADWPAHLEWAERREPCTILDISGWGARVRATVLPEISDHVRLVIENVCDVEAEIAWRRDGDAGLRFHHVQRWVADLQDTTHAQTRTQTGRSGSPQDC